MPALDLDPHASAGPIIGDSLCTLDALQGPGSNQVNSTAQIRNGTCFVTMYGEFDRANVDKLAAEVDACLMDSTSPSVLFDFGSVTFVNGSVLSLLYEVYDRLGDEAWLGVARPRPQVEHLFKVAGLFEMPNFHVFPTLAEALEVVDRG